jgi:hypothetical protein
MADVRSAALGLVMAALASACSGDLLHSTSWPTRCEINGDAEGCGSGGSSDGGSGGAGGGGASSASNGGAGLVQAGGASSSGAERGAGGSGTGGAGGVGPCATCFEYVQMPDPNVPPCPESEPELNALIACACAACAAECGNNRCGTGMQDQVCTDCVQQAALALCTEEFQACVSDN